MFQVTGLKILGSVGTYIFFSGKKYNFMHIFPRKPEKNSRFPLNTGIFYLALYSQIGIALDEPFFFLHFFIKLFSLELMVSTVYVLVKR